MKNLLIPVLVTVLFALNSGCQLDKHQIEVVDKSYDINQLNSLILEEISNSKIVLLGDCAHGHGSVYRKLTDFLNYWLDLLENDNITSQIHIPKKLVLFIEMSDKDMEYVNYYFNNADFQPYLDYKYELVIGWGGFEKFTIDELEYLYDLREIKQRMHTIKTKNKLDIDFQIVGPEIVPPYTLETKNLDKIRSDYFVKERDLIASRNIIHYLKSHPDYRVLVFYGTAHLIRHKVNKGQWTRSKQEMEGYLLAHYLDKHFKRSNVIVFMTQAVLNTNTTILKYKTEKEIPDYFVPVKLTPRIPCSMNVIKGELNMQIQYDLFKEYASKIKKDRIVDYKWKYFTNYFNQIFTTHVITEDNYYQQSKALYKEFQNQAVISEMIDKYEAMGEQMLDHFDAIENINSIGVWTNYKEIKTLCEPYLSPVLSNLYNYQNISDSSNFNFNELIILNQNSLKTHLFINLLWIANEEEKGKAITELKQLTGYDFKTPKEWSIFWRTKYDNQNGNDIRW